MEGWRHALTAEDLWTLERQNQAGEISNVFNKVGGSISRSRPFPIFQPFPYLPYSVLNSSHSLNATIYQIYLLTGTELGKISLCCSVIVFRYHMDLGNVLKYSFSSGTTSMLEFCFPVGTMFLCRVSDSNSDVSTFLAEFR